MPYRLFAALLLLMPFAGRAAIFADSAVNAVERRLHICIQYDTLIPDRWGAVAYQVPADSAQLMGYITLLEREFAKYPENYFTRACADTIVLCTRLNYLQQNRAAVPAPEDHRMYLAVDGAYGVADENYLVHVMHHELNHCAEYALWKNMFYRWAKWAHSNRLLYRYKGAGAMAYADLSIDWYGMVHPGPGFVNLYSTTAQEEDRAEIVSLIMGDLERSYLITYAATDKKLQKKIALALKFLNQVSGTTNNFWTTAMEITGIKPHK